MKTKFSPGQAPTTMDEQYEAAAEDASKATENASDNPTLHNHRLAAEAHLAAARHAHLTGKGDTAEEHDAKALEHMAAMDACEAGSSNVPKVAPLKASAKAEWTDIKALAAQLEAKCPGVMAALKAAFNPAVAKRAALQAKANARMKADAPLMAGIKAGGYSFTDMQNQLRAELEGVDFGDEDETENMCCPSYWVCDILAPGHEVGETWEAIVSGPCGKMYCVKFTLGADGVEVVGDPAEVRPETDYDYVAEEAKEVSAMDATQLAELMAENPEGINQYTKGGGAAADKAKSLGEKAARLTGDAERTGKQEDHEKAADANTEAASAHNRAAEKAMNNGDKEAEAYHRKEAMGHNHAAWQHNQKAVDIHEASKAAKYKAGDTIAEPKSEYDRAAQLYEKNPSYVVHQTTGKVLSVHSTPAEAIRERDKVGMNHKVHFQNSLKSRDAGADGSLQAKHSATKRFEMASKEAKDCSASIPAIHARAEALHRIAAEHGKLANMDHAHHVEAAEYHSQLKGPALPHADTTAVPVTPSDNATANLTNEGAKK